MRSRTIGLVIWRLVDARNCTISPLDHLASRGRRDCARSPVNATEPFLVVVAARCVLATPSIDAPSWFLDYITHRTSTFFAFIRPHAEVNFALVMINSAPSPVRISLFCTEEVH